MALESIRIRLDESEYRALIHLSELELRPLADQARTVIRDELRQRGLIHEEVPNATPAR